VDYLGMMREVAPGLALGRTARFPALRHVLVVSDRAHADTIGWREMLEGGRRVSDDALRERARAVDPGDSAFVFYTSGTTGFPKGAVHDHRIIRNTSDMADRMGVTVDDIILMYLPLFHAFGFICGALMSMIRGARQVLTETFDRQSMRRSHRRREGDDDPRGSTRTSRICSTRRTRTRVTCRACARASAARAWRALFPSRGEPARRSGTS
jgi:fatty-acyl-CoA synthase